MSYRAKRIILLFMLWGLMIFTALHVRQALSEPAVPSVDATPPAAAAPTAPPDRVSQLQAALDRDPRDLEAMVELAGILYAEQDYESSLAIYRRAQQLNPHNVDLLIKIGMCQLYLLRFAEARDTFSQAVGLDPNRAEAHLLLGLALSKLEPPQLEAARSAWESAERLAPGSDIARQARALIDQSRQ